MHMKFKNEDGISGNIGVMLIITVAVIGIAVVGVTVTSQDTPDEVPNLDIIIGCDQSPVNTSEYDLTLFHNGGDTISASEFEIQAYNVAREEIHVRSCGGSSDDAWSIGNTISFIADDEPASILIMYTAGSAGAMLKSLDLRVPDNEEDIPQDVFVDETGTPTATPTGSPTVTPTPTPTPGIQDFIDANVFILGKRLHFEGNSINGPGATVILTDGNLDKNELKSNPDTYVTNIYVNGYVDLPNGDEDLGSPTHPGEIHVNGDLTLKEGQRHIYGTVYVNGDCYLKGPNIHGNMYVDGNLDIGPGHMSIDDNARIYYTGIFTYGSGVPESVISKCIKWVTIPGVQLPDIEIPSLKSADWYAAKGYSSGGTLTSNLKIYAESYTPPQEDQNTAYNVIIIAYNGDISLTHMQGKYLTGILIAPRGKVAFKGKSFEGVAITRDGFFDEQGGSTVTFKNIGLFIDDPDDYPF